MYEDYFGFAEKPFSLTPDPKFLYRSESHGGAFDLLQYAIRRREGFVVVTGDIGTGKTTLRRAILEQLDTRTFTALVLNPFLTEAELLKLVLHDFGVVSRDELKRGRLAGVSPQELIDTLNDFLLSLLPIGGRAVLIVDEAQNLSHHVLEQIRILSNLETDKEKLLQVVLVGQLNLRSLMRSPELRQLDQRVSIRYELRPLTREETAAYVAHRLHVAGGVSVTFTPRAMDLVHRFSKGTPRLINLLCDRSLLGGYAARTSRIDDEIVVRAAEGLDLRTSGRAPGPLARLRRRAAMLAAGTVASALVGLTGAGLIAGGWLPIVNPATAVQAVAAAPAAGSFAILVGSFEEPAQASAITADLEQRGYRTYQIDIDRGPGQPRHDVFVGGYRDETRARTDEVRLRAVPGYGRAVLVGWKP